MPGDRPDRVTVESRRALLDAFEALAPHIDRLVLVGAHAVYLHTDDIVTGIALFTTDADVAMIPPVESWPDIKEAMQAADFQLGTQPGIWQDGDRQVDLLVPDAMSPRRGRRDAGLPGHGERSARNVTGLEGAAVDNAYRMIAALDPEDGRQTRVRVAGPAALIVSKAFKLSERETEVTQRRLFDKDAFDVYRLLQLPEPRLVTGFERMFADPTSSAAAHTGAEHLARLFGAVDATGTVMAARHVEGVGDPDTVRQAVVALATDLLHATSSTTRS